MGGEEVLGFSQKCASVDSVPGAVAPPTVVTVLGILKGGSPPQGSRAAPV